MRKLNAISQNVWEWIHKASADVAKVEEERFAQEMHSQLIDNEGLTSPIEQMFFVALHAMGRAYSLSIDPEPFEHKGIEHVGFGVFVHPQSRIDQYRVDFLLSHWRGDVANRIKSEVIVELDGHAFHDKDKRQRSYEKARDRHLTRRGYRVLHYTGSDLCADPYKVAHEVLETLGCFGSVGSEPYDRLNPLNLLQ